MHEQRSVVESNMIWTLEKYGTLPLRPCVGLFLFILRCSLSHVHFLPFSPSLARSRSLYRSRSPPQCLEPAFALSFPRPLGSHSDIIHNSLSHTHSLTRSLNSLSLTLSNSSFNSSLILLSSLTCTLHDSHVHASLLRLTEGGHHTHSLTLTLTLTLTHSTWTSRFTSYYSYS